MFLHSLGWAYLISFGDYVSALTPNCLICALWAGLMSGCGKLTTHVIAIMLLEISFLPPLIYFHSRYLSSWPQESAISRPIVQLQIDRLFSDHIGFY